jgi:recombinational DNA repair protein RecT
MADHVNQYCPDAANDWSPWKTAWKEMAKKTMIRRLAKRVPLSVEFSRAAMIDTDNDITPVGEEIQISFTDDHAPTNVEQLKQKLTDQNGGAKQEQKPEHVDQKKDEKSVDDLVNETIGTPNMDVMAAAKAAAAKQKPTFNAEDGIR